MTVSGRSCLCPMLYRTIVVNQQSLLFLIFEYRPNPWRVQACTHVHSVEDRTELGYRHSWSYLAFYVGVMDSNLSPHTGSGKHSYPRTHLSISTDQLLVLKDSPLCTVDPTVMLSRDSPYQNKSNSLNHQHHSYSLGL